MPKMNIILYNESKHNILKILTFLMYKLQGHTTSVVTHLLLALVLLLCSQRYFALQGTLLYDPFAASYLFLHMCHGGQRKKKTQMKSKGKKWRGDRQKKNLSV